MASGLIAILLLFALTAACTLLANRIVLPAPVLLTTLGIVLAFVPLFPTIHLHPELVLLAILPPLVYQAAVVLPWEEFRQNLRPISMFAVGLVAVTTGCVAAVAHWLVPNLGWAEAFVLGAIVSPTDPVASTAVAERLGVPRRITAIIEGEGMVNDAIALTVYRLALAAAISGAFSASEGLLRFGAIVVGEIAFGVFVGWAFATIRTHISDRDVEITVSLLTPFAAYLPPEALGGSGVLATVAAGMYMGVKAPSIVPSGTRLQLATVWQTIVYLLNGVLFLLTGLQFRSVLNSVHGLSAPVLVDGAAIAGAVICTRAAWAWPSLRVSDALARRRENPTPNRHVALIAWCGMRGGISLAAALAIPLAFGARPLILFLTAAVISATLLVEGATLPLAIRKLRLDRDAADERRRTRESAFHARIAAAEAALDCLDGDGTPAAELLRSHYRHRIDTLHGLLEAGSAADAEAPAASEAKLHRDAIRAERERVRRLHHEGKIPEIVLHDILRDLDIAEASAGTLAVE